MALNGTQAYALSKKYTEDSLDGVGALKGAPCTIKSNTHQNGRSTIVFEWTSNSGVVSETTVTVLDGTPIYEWQSGDFYDYSDLVIYASCFYRCITPNSDVEFDDTKWNELGSADGNYDIVQNSTLLPSIFTAADRKMYYSIEDEEFYFWNGYEWGIQKKLIQYDALPVASSTNVNEVVQYLGATSDGLTHGYFYECVEDSGIYSWNEVKVQDTHVEASETNGNIVIDGVETPVYDDTEIDGRLDDVEQDLSTSTKTVTGNPLNFSTLTAQKANETVISLEPIQDLHGYDHPWPAGGGKNLIPMTVDGIKAANTSGTWDGNSYARSGVIFTVQTDGGGNVIGISVSGTATYNSDLYIPITFADGINYILNGGVNGGSDSTYKLQVVYGFRFDNIATCYDTNDKEFVYTSSLENTYVRIRVYNGYSISGNIVFKPMIRLSTETDPTFAPYSNICPIDGRTETSLVGCGKNLVNIANVSELTIPATGNMRYGIILPKIHGTITFKGINSTDTTANIAYDIYLNNVRQSREWIVDNGVGSTKTVQIADGEIVYLYNSNSTSTAENTKSIFTACQIQAEIAPQATDYEPYTPSNNLTIQFREKVYGATVELEKGTVTVEWGYIASYNGETLPGEWISDRDVYAPNTSPSTGAEVAYELASPRTITLTPNEISLLKGVNNISTDGDSISLTYRDGKVATLGDLDELNSTISNALDGKVDEVSGKGLSTNDYTNEEKAKVAEIDAKANDDGSYGDMAVGSLLMSNAVKSTDTTPFLFRPIPPISTPYIREKLVGASMAWNQLVANGDFASATGWTVANGTLTVSGNIGTFTMSGTSTAARIEQNLSILANHVYMFFASITPSVTTTIQTNFGAKNVSGETETKISIVSKPSSNDTVFRLYVNVGGRLTSNDTVKFKNIIIIDLTLAFGTAIADRIYSMEQAQAGSGIAWIKSYGFLTDDYYAYDAGSIQSVCADRKEIVGKNKVDAPDTSDFHNNTIFKNKPLKAGTYTLSVYVEGSLTPMSQWNVQADGVVLNMGYIYSNTRNSLTFVLSSDTTTFQSYCNTSASVNIKEIMVEEGSTATTYEPYHKTTISLGHDTLRGVMQLDANNNLVYVGDEKASDGVIDRKFGIVDLGTLTWTYDSNNRFVSNIISELGRITTSRQTPCICSKYITIVDGRSLAEVPDKSSYIAFSTSTGVDGCIYIHDSAYNDATTFTTAMSGVYFIYPLGTPTTEQSTPFESPQYLFDGGTEEFVDYPYEQQTRDVAVPVGHVTEYIESGEDKVFFPTLPSADGEYIPHIRIHGGMITGFWFESVIEDGD